MPGSRYHEGDINDPMRVKRLIRPERPANTEWVTPYLINGADEATGPRGLFQYRMNELGELDFAGYPDLTACTSPAIIGYLDPDYARSLQGRDRSYIIDIVDGAQLQLARLYVGADPTETVVEYQALEATWPIGGGKGVAVYAIEVFENIEAVIAGDEAFEWEIPEDLDDSTLVKVEGYVTTASSGGLVNVQVHNQNSGHDMLSTPVTIDVGELNSKTALDQPVVDTNWDTVSWGDHLRIDVDNAGVGATGLGMILYFAPSAMASVVLEGYQGPAGGVTNWRGTWAVDITYLTGEAVSNDGTSYVAIQSSIGVEPGVTSGWESYWQVIAQSILWRGDWSSVTVYAVQDAVSNNSSSYVAIAPSTDVEPGVDVGWESYWQVLAQGNVYKEVEVIAFQAFGAVIAGDDRAHYVVSALLGAKNLARAEAAVITASTSGALAIQVRNTTQAVDMLTNPISIDANEKTSYTAATPSLVNPTNSDVAVGDIISIDVDNEGLGATGLIVVLTFTA